MQISSETESTLKVFRRENEDLMGRSPSLWEKGLTRRLDLVVAHQILRKLEKHERIKGKRILDIGSGMGDFMLACYQHGAIPLGIEPDNEHIDFSKSWFQDNKAEIHLCQGIGEKLPFREGTFDIVSCNTVLEHVDNPAVVIKEVVRVLKPDGIFFLNGPNYLFPWEPHYCIVWFPYLPKTLAKVYLKLLKKPCAFVEHINYISTPSYLRITRKAGLTVRASWIEDIISNPSLVVGRYRAIVKTLKFFHVPKFLISLVSPSITLIFVKHEIGRGNLT